jgi:RNA polymerase sigma-70 factor (ECF subfamily)
LLGKVKDPADHQSWLRFVDRYGRRIYAWGRKSGLPPADADDVTQEVLVKLVKALPDFRYDGDRGRCRGFLRTITRNAVSDFLRGNQYRADRAVGGSTAGLLIANPDNAIEQLIEELDYEAHRELMQEILTELRSHRINQTDLDVFELHVLDGLTHAEISSRVGKSIGAVYTALSRARKKVESEFASRGKLR